MAVPEDVILSLEEKIKRIIRIAEALKHNNEQLQQQIDELSERLHIKDREIEVLESKYQSLKLTKTLAASPEEVKNVKHQVTRIVREIDKCIALLNK